MGLTGERRHQTPRSHGKRALNIAMVANLELLKLSERSTFSEAMLQKLVDLYLITWYSLINGF